MGALKPGYQVTTEIRLLRRLGAGGMGSVWVAEHAGFGRHVVVKFLSEALAADPSACVRFSREAVAASEVDSPHVVKTFAHGITEGGTPYIVMELLEGRDLASVLRERTRLRPDEVVHIVEGVAEALSVVHKKGIVHRDVKPANVFLCDRVDDLPFVKLVDFGIAKRLEDESLTATNEMIGTPSYMSPEQLVGGEPIDRRSDLWALGVLAYHALTGTPPFRGPHVANVVHAILNTPITSPKTIRPELPIEIDAWFTRALAREPSARFASPFEMAAAFKTAMSSAPIILEETRLEAAVGRAKEARASDPASSSPAPLASTPSGTSAGDVVESTFGASIVTHAPHRAPIPWRSIAFGAVGASVVILAFSAGYALRKDDAKQGDTTNAARSATSPPPPSAPVSAPLVAPVTATATPTTATATATATTMPTASANASAATPPSKKPGTKSRGHKPSSADDDDVGF